MLGGISRMWHELINNIMLLSDDIRFVISINKKTKNVFFEMIKQLASHYPHKLTIINEKKHLFSNSKILDQLGHIRAYQNRIRLMDYDDDIHLFHSSFASTILPKLEGIPTVTTVHDLSIQKFKYLFATSAKNYFHYYRRLITRNLAIKNADYLIAVSQATKNDLIDINLDENKIKVIHNGISNFWYPVQNKGKNNSKPYFLFVGGRNPYKNYDTVLKAISLLDGKYKDIQLITVGENVYSQKREMKKYLELNIHEKVTDLGTVSDEKLRELYSNAVAFVFPSKYEGFGFPLLESLACGCPVIASKIPTNREIGGSFVHYFKATDSSELADKMMDIYNNLPGEAERMRYSTYAHTYTWENAARKLLEVYRTLT
ncbi:MAG: glycosyltransferase family 4 protein [Planctomycetota bacterium]|jgi:glycosyltransferase involved in cell wall biosynthesis